MSMKRTLVISAAALAALFAPSAQGAPAPQTLTISASAATMKFGGSVTLSGKLTGGKFDAKNVTVREDPFPIGGFANGGSATTNATGDWSLVVKPFANTRYQARSGKADSPAVDVMVRPAISLKLSDRTPKRGQRVNFSGTLCPEHDGVAIALQKRTATGWRTVAAPVLADVAATTCSSYAKRLRVRRNGSYRARFLGDADHVAGNSVARRATVH
jgi:hypothetical protein